MNKSIILVLAALACTSAGRQSTVQAVPIGFGGTPTAGPTLPSGPPPWAYGFAAAAAPAVSGGGATPVTGGGRGAAAAGGIGGAGGRAGAGGRGAAAPDTTRHSALGSSLSFTLAQVRDSYGPADWFPSDHGEMPPIVKSGRREAQILACSLCHYPNGKGRPENAGISGLPESYIVRTMLDFKNDNRKSSDARKANTNRMIAFTKAMTDAEIHASAQYFAAISWTPWIRVVEAELVPKTRIAGGMFIAIDGAEAGTEPIGQRIIEVPENTEQAETLRNSRSGFIAYVPTGAIAKGEAISAHAQCTLCHGVGLKGLGPVPGIAGRSPSYLVRQLYDMQTGARKGEWGELMKSAVAAMSVDDMISIAAFAASRAP